MLTTVDTKIIEALARTLFLLAWADYQEQVLDSPVQGEIDDAAPKTPVEVINYAYYVAGQIEQLNKDSLFFLLRKAAKADDEQPEVYTDDEVVCTRFGHCLAMMVTGNGISWFDDHEKFDLKVPRIEFTYLDLDEGQFPGNAKDAEEKNLSDVEAAKKELQDAINAETMALATGKDSSECRDRINQARHDLLLALKQAKKKEPQTLPG
jgi:hypothetical protein